MTTTGFETPAPADIQRGLAQVRAQLWARLRRGALFMAVLSLAIAALFTALDGKGFFYKLLYSACIGACCWLLTDGLRVLTTWLAERARVLRGEPPADGRFRIGWRGMLPLMALSVVGGPVVGTAIADRITGFNSPSMLNLSSPAAMITLTVTVIASLAALFILSTLERLSNARIQAQAAQRAAAENQLKLLESQLEPHMLFNTLANLRVLIGLDAARAQAMLDHLIAFLRATLNASRTGQHPLSAEFERLQDYLALMAVRMGPRLQVLVHLPDDLRVLPVPPLLLQPLVENGIKHGLEPQVAGGRIEIGAERDDNTLVLTVRDTGVGLGAPASTAGTRFGLEQVRSRLHTLYGERATFSLTPATDEAGGTLARITLPLETA